MDLKEIRTLIDLMKKNDLTVFEMEREGFRITLKKEHATPAATPAAPVSQAPPPAVPPPAGGETPPAAGGGEPAATGREITSPMVGTFYRSPSPDGSSFVEPGQEVAEDTVVCIIEAMKVMNEIKAEQRGVIAEVLAENGKPVQFGQPLFRLK